MKKRTFDITKKARAYQALAQMSSAFSEIVKYCEELEQAGALTPQFRFLYQALTIDLQGEIDHHILQNMTKVSRWMIGIELARSAASERIILRAIPRRRDKAKNPTDFLTSQGEPVGFEVSI